MRPEYLEGVDAVRWGWSYWLMIIVPATLIWLSALAWLQPWLVEKRLRAGRYSVPAFVNATCIAAIVLVLQLYFPLGATGGAVVTCLGEGLMAPPPERERARVRS